MHEPGPHRPALAAEKAVPELRADAKSGRLDGDAVEAVLGAAGQLADGGTEYLQFSPAEELRTVSETIMRNMQQMQGS